MLVGARVRLLAEGVGCCLVVAAAAGRVLLAFAGLELAFVAAERTFEALELAFEKLKRFEFAEFPVEFDGVRDDFGVVDEVCGAAAAFVNVEARFDVEVFRLDFAG